MHKEKTTQYMNLESITGTGVPGRIVQAAENYKRQLAFWTSPTSVYTRIKRTLIPRHREAPSLDAIGVSNGVDQSSLHHDYLSSYQEQLHLLPIEIKNIVIISGSNPVATANTFAEFFSDAQVHLFHVRKVSEEALSGLRPNVKAVHAGRIRDLHSALRNISTIQVIIEDGSNKKSHKLDCFRQLFYYLQPNGMYVVEDLHAGYLPQFVDREGESVGDLLYRLMGDKTRPATDQKLLKGDDRELGDSIDRLTVFGKIAFVRKKGIHYVKLRDYETTETLNERYGATWGRVVAHHEEGRFVSGASVTTNRPDLEHRFPREISFPSISCREYNSVRLRPGQVALMDNLVLPDTFRHLMAHELKNKYLVNANSRFARLPSDADETYDFLSGKFYYLDTEHPGIYGHVTTEIISRLWAWRECKAAHPDLKILVCPAEGQSDIPRYEREMFQAFGISESDIHCVFRPTMVETLFAATPMFSNPKYVVPAIANVWNDLRDRLREARADHPKRVFLARNPGSARDCRNAGQVEAIFKEHGFAILLPETLPLSSQVDLFASADVIAGYGGSALLNGVFSSGAGTRIVISPETYNTANEYLISSIFSDNFHYFWCPSEIQHPEGGWTERAFQSPFKFDFENDGARLRTLLESLDS